MNPKINISFNLPRVILMCMALFVSIATNAQLEITQVQSQPNYFHPGQVNQIQVSVELDDPGQLEYADYIIFEFPTGWNIQITAGAPNPSSSSCGPVIVAGHGTNRMSFGVSVPGTNPTGGSGCGVFEMGTYTFYMDVLVPASVNSNQAVAVQVLGDGYGQSTYANVTSNLILFYEPCILTCPADITVEAQPGQCGAYVSIDPPTTSGICPAIAADKSGFYPVGTTEVSYMSNYGSCTFTVQVNDTSAPTIAGPGDQILNLKGGQCSSKYNYVISANDNCATTIFDLSQTNITTVNSNLACYVGQTYMAQVFDLNALGITTDLDLNAIEVAVFQSFNNPSLTLNVYELTGDVLQNEMQLIATTQAVLPELFDSFYDVPIQVSMDAKKKYLVELVTPGGVPSGLILGTHATNNPITDSYVKASFCNVPSYTKLTNMDLLLRLKGLQQPVKISQTAGIASGGDFPEGITQNTFEAVDQYGNTTSYSFNVQVNAVQNSIKNITCNNKVHVSLDKTCSAILTPDMILEGGPYLCWDNYTVIIKDKNGKSYGNVITSDMVDMELFAEVYDQNGFSCTGNILIEDKLAPSLSCTARVTQCNEDTTPGALLSEVIRVAQPNLTNNFIPTSGTMMMPFPVSGMHGALIKDLNVELDIKSSYSAGFSIALVSPQGTEVPLFVPKYCDVADLKLVFDDQATNNLYDLNCSDELPGVSGLVQPLYALSAFNEEPLDGTWILKIENFTGISGAFVDKMTLEFTQEGAAIGLPIPADASYEAIDDNSFYVYGLDPCGTATLKYEDNVQNMDCTSPYTKVIYRTYTATDASGNDAVSCMDTIYVKRTTLKSLKLPLNYDGKEAPALSCTDPYPTPDTTGMPTGAFCDNVQITHKDVRIDLCGNSYKILRKWTIYEWCTGETEKHTQIIQVIDQEAPVISCTGFNKPVSTAFGSCVANVLLPVPTISDNCSTTSSYTVELSAGDLQTLGQNSYSVDNLPIGIHTVTYTASDECGNTSSCSFDFEVSDQVPPNIVCDKNTNVALTLASSVEVSAKTFDDGSYDDCSNITYAVRRMSNLCVEGDTLFAQHVTFCCADIGEEVMVALEVTDASGNKNTCMVSVQVEDKIPPAIQVPADVTLKCYDDYTNLNLTNGTAKGYDNCGVHEPKFKDYPAIGNCGSGLVKRVWTVEDHQGLMISDTQRIYLYDDDPFTKDDITWAKDTIIESCDAHPDPSVTGRPIIQDDICSQVSFKYEDQTFIAIEGACKHIYRKWTIIDECQYDSSVPNKGIWEDIQVIQIENTSAPVFNESCKKQTIYTTGVCEGEVELKVEAVDDCTPQNELTYTWKVDMYNKKDNIYEAQGGGNTMKAVFPNGTHRIVWSVSDNCDNRSWCEYEFEVKDGKAPTPICLSAISTAIMNNNGQVEIWSKDFIKEVTDNCTAQEDLIVSFDPDGKVLARTFDCSDIPNGVEATIEMEVYVIDEAGNSDFCTVQILVQDNEANFCNDKAVVEVSGKVMTMYDDVIHKVDLTAQDAAGKQEPMKDLGNGKYAFNLLADQHYKLKASKNTDVLNGVSTLDIVLIQKHILGIEPFDSPYTLIAADANNSGSINGSDLVSIRKLILGYTEQFPNGQESWRFVDRDFKFSSPMVPFPFKEYLDIKTSEEAMNNQDFIGVKIGDVNNSVHPTKLVEVSEARSIHDLTLRYKNQKIQTGELVDIPIYASGFEELQALQVHVGFDTDVVTFESIHSGALELETGSMNLDHVHTGSMALLWTNPRSKTIAEDQVLFTIRARAMRTGELGELLEIAQDMLSSVAYNTQLEAVDIRTALEGEQSNSKSSGLVLMDNVPNPFTDYTMIRFESGKTQEITLRVYDMNGRLVHHNQVNVNKGKQELRVSQDELKTTGVYYYTLSNAEQQLTGKMIRME